MGIATNVLGILKLATGAARIGRGGSTVDADLETLENGQTTLNDTLTAEAGKVATLQRQVAPLARAVRVAMTGASSGSRGWLVQDNPEVNFGTGDFTLHWEGSLPDYSPSSVAYLLHKISGVDGFGLSVRTTGVLRVEIAPDFLSADSSSAISLNGGSYAKITASIVRETASSAGSVTFYLNGIQFGDSYTLPAGTPSTVDNLAAMYISGRSSERTACDVGCATIFNRALSASEVQDIAINGTSLADIGAPGNRASNVSIVGNSDFESWFSPTNLQVWTEGSNVSASIAQVTGGDQYSGTYSVQFDGAGVPSVTVNNVIMQDKFSVSDLGRRVRFIIAARRISGSGDLHVGQGSDQYSTISTAGSGLNSDWKLFVVEKTLTNLDNAQRRQVQFSGDSGSTFQVGLFETQFLGITGLWSAEHAQSDTGQIFDQINGNHALLPSAGATIHPQPEGLRQVKATLTWNGDATAKYLLSNQDILPEGAEIERVTAVIEGTPIDGTLGDPSDPDRYCTLEKNTGLIEGSNRLALSERTTDGTNRELLWTPSAAFTGTIKFTIHYFVGEQ